MGASSAKSSKHGSAPSRSMAREEWFLGVGVISSLVFVFFGHWLVKNLTQPSQIGLVLLWLFIVVLGSVFCVVRHADHLAFRLGEPYGTLILTLAVTSIEVISITALMTHDEDHPALVRDTLMAVVMIILNGMVGLCLLIGGWRHREQVYNLQGANAYLSVIIPLAVLSLVLPTFTITVTGPILSATQEVFLGLMAVALYGTFLAIQTGRHRGYFTLGEDEDHHEQLPGTQRSITAHSVLLVVYMSTVAYLAEHLAWPLGGFISAVNAPPALSGILIAVLVATPEAIGAVRAARANQLQRSVNIFLGSVLATIGLTIPTMMIASHLTHRKFVLGLQNADLIMLPLTLVLCVVTFGSGRTNILQGVVHLLLFAFYILLVFQG